MCRSSPKSAAKKSLANLGIIVPTLNSEKTLHQTLQSVRIAISRGATAVIVDGGSCDATADIAAFYDIPITMFPGNMYTAINYGANVLNRQWLTWINSDDLLYAEGLEARLRHSAHADVVYGPVDFVDHAGRFKHCWHSARPSDLLLLYRGGYSPLLQQGTIFSKTYFLNCGGFDDRFNYVGDADFWWRGLERNAVFVRQSHPPAAAFRLHEDQMSRRHSLAMHEEHLTMARGKTKSTRLSAFLALIRYRVENAHSYVIRTLRARDINGRARATTSYHLNTHQAPMSPHPCGD